MAKTIKCDCGASVVCEGFTNVCGRCGAFYNFSGQQLAHPSQWGDETGESFDDNGNYVIGSGDPDYGDLDAPFGEEQPIIDRLERYGDDDGDPSRYDMDPMDAARDQPWDGGDED
jgi:hypothetical protein